MGTTNILDLNNRLSKVEKENVAQNSYTSLKNKPKINNVTLTGNKSLADIGAAAAADLGELTDLTTTDKSSCVGAINEVNGKLTKTQTVANIDPTYKHEVEWNIIKQGNICVLSMWNLKDIPNGYTNIGTIPDGFRPEMSFYEYVYSANKDVNLGFNFMSNGVIQVINPTGATLSGDVFLNRNVTYFTA